MPRQKPVKAELTTVYASGLDGYEVGILPGGESAAWRYCPPGQQPREIRRSRIRYTAKGRAYFLAYGQRIHLDQCLRKDAGR